MPGIIGAGRSPPHRSSMARHTSRRDTSAFSPRFHVVFAVGAESRIGTPLGHASRASLGNHFSPSTRYRSAGRPDPVAHSWLQPRDPPAAALRGKHTAKTAQDFCCRDMEATSLCVPFAATRTRTGEVVLVLQTHRWRTTAPWRSRTTGTTSFQSRQFNPFLSG